MTIVGEKILGASLCKKLNTKDTIVAGTNLSKVKKSFLLVSFPFFFSKLRVLRLKSNYFFIGEKIS